MEQVTADHVHDFEDGGREQVDLLGGKGANLAEMTRLGLPVSPGFTIDTEACREYLRSGALPPGLPAAVDAHLARLEQRIGRRLGDPVDPLLVSVRSGARFRWPGWKQVARRWIAADGAPVGVGQGAEARWLPYGSASHMS